MTLAGNSSHGTNFYACRYQASFQFLRSLQPVAQSSAEYFLMKLEGADLLCYGIAKQTKKKKRLELRKLLYIVKRYCFRYGQCVTVFRYK